MWHDRYQLAVQFSSSFEYKLIHFADTLRTRDRLSLWLGLYELTANLLMFMLTAL